jgi:hypothetical protein
VGSDARPYLADHPTPFPGRYYSPSLECLPTALDCLPAVSFFQSKTKPRAELEDDPGSTHVSSSAATTSSQLGCLVLECLTVTLPPDDMVTALPLIHNGTFGTLAGGVDPKPRARAWREVAAADLVGRTRSGVECRSISRERTVRGWSSWGDLYAPLVCSEAQRINMACGGLDATNHYFRLWTMPIGDCRQERTCT